MFRVKESDEPRGHSAAARFVFFALVVAAIVDVGCAYVALREYRALVALRSSTTVPHLPVLKSLERTARLLSTLALMTGVTLVISLGVLGWLIRRHHSHQQSLSRIKLLAHNILASMDQGVVTTDPQDCITSINTAATVLLGVDFECVGQPLSRVESAELALTEMNRRVKSGQGPVWDHNFNVHRNGRVQRLRGAAHVLKDTQGRALGSVLHLRDVTERILMEERMSRMERFISLGSLASGLHHEIKNPLTALSIHVQLLEERLRDPHSTDPVDELIGVLKTEVHRLNGVLESFRNFTNLQRLTIQPTDVLDVLEDVIRLVRPQAAQQQVQITLHHADTMLPLVPLDSEKFEQVLLNLVINSLEAMPAGGILSVEAAIRDGTLQVDVTDTGSGIPVGIQSSVFKPYFSTKSKGTGMGLALTEKLVGQHGGHIDFQTGPGGTTFRLSLPLELRNETP